MSKRYKLLHDMPGVSAGTEYFQHSKYCNRWYPETAFEGDKLIHSVSPLYGFTTENMKDIRFFEEIIDKEKVRVETIIISPSIPQLKENDWAWYSFATKEAIGFKILPAIKQAIENVINGDAEEEKHPLAYCKGFLKGINKGKEYLEMKERNAFNAARKLVFGATVTGYKGEGLTYNTFEDYKKLNQ